MKRTKRAARRPHLVSAERVRSAAKRRAFQTEINRQAQERTMYGVDGDGVLFMNALTVDEGRKPLNAIGKRALGIVDSFVAHGPVARLKADIFTRYRVGSEREPLSPRDLRLYLADVALALAEAFDDLDHQLFDGTRDASGKVIMGGTEVQKKARELAELARQLAQDPESVATPEEV